MVQSRTLKADSTGLSAISKYLSTPQNPQSITSTDKSPLNDDADVFLSGEFPLFLLSVYDVDLLSVEKAAECINIFSS